MLIEAQAYDVIYFVTLTYSDFDIPMCCNLSKRDAQLFLKRLRKNSQIKVKRINPETGRKKSYTVYQGNFRYFLCGEYGERRTLRPHYHAIIYTNEDPEFEFNAKGEITDSIFHRAWYPDSRVDVVPIFRRDDVQGVIQYVAGYVLKKLFKEEDEIERIKGRKPEFTLMSRKPPIGSGQIQKAVEAVSWVNNKIAEGSTRFKTKKRRVQMLRINGKLWPAGRTLGNKIHEQLEDREFTENAADIKGAISKRVQDAFRRNPNYRMAMIKAAEEANKRAQKKINRWKNAKRRVPGVNYDDKKEK
jgi:hypothetical protein